MSSKCNLESPNSGKPPIWYHAKESLKGKMVVYRQWYRWCWSEKYYIWLDYHEKCSANGNHMYVTGAKYKCVRGLPYGESPADIDKILCFSCWLKGFSPVLRYVVTPSVYFFFFFRKQRLISSIKIILIMQTAGFCTPQVLQLLFTYDFSLAPGMLCSNFLSLHFADPKLAQHQPCARGTYGPVKLSSS